MTPPSRLALSALLAAAAVPGAARAQAGSTHAEGGVAWYGNDDALSVTSPWARGTVGLADELTLGVGWTMDAISAATVDVVTSATPSFRETRHEAAVDLRGDARTARFGGGWIGSFETDTHSTSFHGSGEVDLLRRNLTLGVGYGFSWLRVGAVGEPVDLWRDRFVHQIDATAVVTATRTTLLTATYTAQLMRGYLANPYLDVPLFPADEELQVRSRAQWVESRHPAARDRHSLSADVRQAVGRRLFLRAGWRGYLDSWAMRSHAVELGVSFDLGKGVVLEVSDRFHWQSRASFYRAVYTVNRDWITRDRRLGELVTDVARVALRPRIEVGPKGAHIDIAVSAELQWTRYADYRVLDGEHLRPFRDTLAAVLLGAVSWDR